MSDSLSQNPLLQQPPRTPSTASTPQPSTPASTNPSASAPATPAVNPAAVSPALAAYLGAYNPKLLGQNPPSQPTSDNPNPHPSFPVTLLHQPQHRLPVDDDVPPPDENDQGLDGDVSRMPHYSRPFTPTPEQFAPPNYSVLHLANKSKNNNTKSRSSRVTIVDHNQQQQGEEVNLKQRVSTRRSQTPPPSSSNSNTQHHKDTYYKNLRRNHPYTSGLVPYDTYINTQVVDDPAVARHLEQERRGGHAVSYGNNNNVKTRYHYSRLPPVPHHLFQNKYNPTNQIRGNSKTTHHQNNRHSAVNTPAVDITNDGTRIDRNKYENPQRVSAAGHVVDDDDTYYGGDPLSPGPHNQLSPHPKPNTTKPPAVHYGLSAAPASVSVSRYTAAHRGRGSPSSPSPNRAHHHQFPFQPHPHPHHHADHQQQGARLSKARSTPTAGSGRSSSAGVSRSSRKNKPSRSSSSSSTRHSNTTNKNKYIHYYDDLYKQAIDGNELGDHRTHRDPAVLKASPFLDRKPTSSFSYGQFDEGPLPSARMRHHGIHHVPEDLLWEQTVNNARATNGGRGQGFRNYHSGHVGEDGVAQTGPLYGGGGRSGRSSSAWNSIMRTRDALPPSSPHYGSGSFDDANREEVKRLEQNGTALREHIQGEFRRATSASPELFSSLQHDSPHYVSPYKSPLPRHRTQDVSIRVVDGFFELQEIYKHLRHIHV